LPIAIDELRKISYIDADVVQGRTVQLMPLWDGTNWRMWFNLGTGVLIEGKIVDAVESDYVAKSAARETDLFIPFIHIMCQHVSYPEVVGFITAISDDFHNMGTSIAKLKHFWKFRNEIGNGSEARFASTELEYLVALCRTVFDLLQETFSLLWANSVRLTSLEDEAFRKGHPLPKTFSKMVLDQKERPRTADEIVDKFRLPPPLAQQFADAAPFFAQLRKVRDRVIHSGGNFRGVFSTERGFCVDPKTLPFKDFAGWKSEHQYNENISTILPWLADLVIRTIETCNGLVGTFAQIIVPPPAIAPNYLIFVRGPHNDALASLIAVGRGEDPWWDDGAEPKEARPNKGNH
jgi:hypothetical protein